MNLFRFIPGYETHIYDAHKEPLLFLFLTFLITFALTRLYTRMARSRGWGSGNMGGVHVHHVVIGVVLMVIGSILAFSQFSTNAILDGVAAILAGAGIALTLDEFAMIFHLKDVYWAEEGRASIDALFMGLAAAGLLLVSSAPTTDGPTYTLELGSFRLEAGLFVALTIDVVLAAITFLKKKPFLGIVALAFLPAGLVTAIRLGKPGSPWSRWFYDPDRGSARFRERRARKRERSRRRFEEGWSGRFERWFSDLVGGAPHLPSPTAEEGRHE